MGPATAMTSGLGDDAAFSSWSDGGCRYRCPVCGPRQEDFRHSVHFWKHVAESHGLSPKDFARRQRQGQRHPNNLMVVKATMACEECPPGAPFVVFDYGKMVAHLIAKHENLTLRQYYDKHVAKNRTKALSTTSHDSGVDGTPTKLPPTPAGEKVGKPSKAEISQNANVRPNNKMQRKPPVKLKAENLVVVDIEIPPTTASKVQLAKRPLQAPYPAEDKCPDGAWVASLRENNEPPTKLPKLEASDEDFCSDFNETTVASSSDLPVIESVESIAREEEETAASDCPLCDLTVTNAAGHLLAAHDLKPDDPLPLATTAGQQEKGKWIDRNVFQCRMCEESSASTAWRRRHLADCEFPLDDSFKQKQTAIRRVTDFVHECRVGGCGAKVLHDSVSIKVHLKQQHSLAPRAYGEQHLFVAAAAKPSGSNPWATDGNAFRCEYCGEESKKTHFPMSHRRPDACKMSPEEDKRGKPVRVGEKIHFCVICGSGVWHHGLVLYRHMSIKHKMSVNEYTDRCLNNADFKKAEPLPAALEETKTKTPVRAAKPSWSEGNTFKCEYCGAESTKISFLKSHRRVDSCPKSAEADKRGRPTRVTHNVHHCAVCGTGVLHDSIRLLAHLRRHGMTLSEYKSKCLDDPDFKRANPKQGLEKPRELNWFDGNAFQCKYCGQKSAFSYFPSKHREAGACDNSPAEDKRGKVVRVTRKRHHCLICGDGILHDRVRLAFHLKKHSMTLKSYEADCLNNPASAARPAAAVGKSQSSMAWAEGNAFKCSYCLKESTKLLWPLKHSKPGACADSEEENGAGKPVRVTFNKYDCRICSASVWHDRRGLGIHMKRTHDLTLGEYAKKLSENDFAEVASRRPWSEGNTYRCDYCGVEGANGRFLHKHPTAGACAMSPAASKRGKLVRTTDVWHDCLVCGKAVLHDGVNLPRHFNGVHGMTMKQYKEKCIDKAEPAPVAAASKKKHEASWADGNAFKCEYCGVESGFAYFRLAHRQAGACLSSPEEEQRGKVVRLTNVMHNCTVCGESILHDSQLVRGHLKRRHGMSPKEYKTNCLDNPEFERAEPLPPRPQPEDRKQRQQNQIKGHAAESHAWADENVFRCEFCLKESKSSRWAGSHAKSGSCADSKDGAGRGQPVRITEVKHQCRLCGASVLHEARYLYRHMRELHKVSLGQYKALCLDAALPAASAPLTWAEGNAFRCSHCGEQTTRLTWPAGHKRPGRCPAAAETGGDPVRVTETKCSCMLCGESVMHDYLGLNGHLLGSHNISLKLYGKLFYKSLMGDNGPLQTAHEPSQDSWSEREGSLADKLEVIVMEEDGGEEYIVPN